MYPSESCTSSASWCSTACTVKRLRTSWNCANQSQVSHHGSVSDLPPNSSWSYCAVSSAAVTDELSLWLVRWSGIPSRTACGIRLLAGTVSGKSLKTFLFATYWCIQRIRGFTMMCYINRLFTYLHQWVRRRWVSSSSFSKVRPIRRSDIGKIGTHQKIGESDMCTVRFRFVCGRHAACQI